MNLASKRINYINVVSARVEIVFLEKVYETDDNPVVDGTKCIWRYCKVPRLTERDNGI